MSTLLPAVDWAAGLRWGSALLVVGALPLVLVVATAFLKFSVVLALLRRALGVPEVPPTVVLTALAVLLTARAMAPVAGQMATAAGELPAQPTADQLTAAAVRAAAPLSAFLTRHAEASEVEAFQEVAKRQGETTPRADAWLVALPAFALTELKEAFWIGFLLFLPFLVLDLVVGSVLLATGLPGLNATAVALPFKLLLFVAMDGWSLVARGLVLGYT